MDPAISQKIEKVTAMRAALATGDNFNTDEEMEQERSAALFKLIIIGDTGVGKSCILARLIKSEFKDEHNVTIGVEFGNYAMVLNNESLIKLQIWDTAGQESFRSITRIFYKGSHAVMLVFDITTRESFNSIRNWQKEIENNAEQGIIQYLVGNFADEEDKREVTREEAIGLVKELGFDNYIETSAYTGLNVASLFETLTKHLYVVYKNKLKEFVSTAFKR